MNLWSSKSSNRKTWSKYNRKDKKAKSKDKEVVRVVEEIKKARVKELQEEEWQIEGKLVLKEGKVYILKDKELRVEII